MRVVGIVHRSHGHRLRLDRHIDDGVVTISSGATGTGEGDVRFTAARTRVRRAVAITVGGQTFTVTQGTGCAITLATATFDAAAGGAARSVNPDGRTRLRLDRDEQCELLSVTSGANGTGNGTSRIHGCRKHGPGSSGHADDRRPNIHGLTGRELLVRDFARPGLSAGGRRLHKCERHSSRRMRWTASASAPWLAVNSGNSGTGNGSVRLAIQENTGAPRSAVPPRLPGRCSLSIRAVGVPTASVRRLRMRARPAILSQSRSMLPPGAHGRHPARRRG